MVNKIVLFSGFAIIVVVLFLYFFFSSVFEKKENVSPLFPTPTIFQVNEPAQHLQQIYKPQVDSYSAPYIQTLSIISPVVISFSTAIDQTKVTYDITPSTEIFTVWGNSDKTVEIKPKTFWKPDVNYSLTLYYQEENQKNFLYKVAFKAINHVNDN